MRFPRMTTRRWMAVVAVVAISLGVGAKTVRWHRIARRRQQTAIEHAQFEVLHRRFVESWGADARKYLADAHSLRRQRIPDDPEPLLRGTIGLLERLASQRSTGDRRQSVEEAYRSHAEISEEATERHEDRPRLIFVKPITTPRWPGDTAMPRGDRGCLSRPAHLSRSEIDRHANTANDPRAVDGARRGHLGCRPAVSAFPGASGPG
jgi:hypothetical protein